MHTGARGHEVEHRHSYFLCPKTEKQNKGEKPSWESHAYTCKRSQVRAL